MTREEAIARIKDHKIVHKMNEPRAIYISEALDMAIKALEQEPCEDAISRQAAINVADYTDYIGLAVEDVKKVTDAVVKELKCLPSVTPKQSGWIPVSERLPKEGKTVIASTKDGVYPEAKYTKYGWLWAYEAGADYWVDLEDVTAWMPLPKLYVPDTNIGKMSEIPIGSNGVELQESEGKDV